MLLLSAFWWMRLCKRKSDMGVQDLHNSEKLWWYNCSVCGLLDPEGTGFDFIMIASLLLPCCSFSFVFGCRLFFGGFKCFPVNGCSIVVILLLSHLPSGPILNLQNPLVYLGSFICGEQEQHAHRMPHNNMCEGQTKT